MLHDFLTSNWLINPQLDLLLLLQHFRSVTHGFLDEFFCWISFVGIQFYPYFIFCFIYWCLSTIDGMALLFAFPFGITFNNVMKNIFCVERPWVLNPKIHPLENAWGYSFPSGHAHQSALGWGGPAIANWGCKFINIFFLLLAISVAFSRMYIGVHTLQDITVGFITAFAIIFAFKELIKWFDRGTKRDAVVLVSFYVVVLVVYCLNEYVPFIHNLGIIKWFVMFKRDCFLNTGSILGLLTGYYLNRRYIKFNPQEGNIWFRIISSLVGVYIVFWLFVYFYIFRPILGPFVFRLLHYFTVTMFVTVIYPLILNRLKKFKFCVK